MKKIILLTSCLCILLSCKFDPDQNTIEQWKSEVIQTEKDFSDLSQKEGIVKAFQTYAAPDGVIKRGKKIIQGNSAITKWYQEDVRTGDVLTWKPDFVDVSKSGDLAYTYGSYLFISVDSTGTKKESTGKFHTVWKRQLDGNWRFVWD